MLSIASRAYNSPWLDYDDSSSQCPTPLLALHCTPHFLPHGETWTSTKSFFALLGSSIGQIQNTGSCQRRGLKSLRHSQDGRSVDKNALAAAFLMQAPQRYGTRPSISEEEGPFCPAPFSSCIHGLQYSPSLLALWTVNCSFVTQDVRCKWTTAA